LCREKSGNPALFQIGAFFYLKSMPWFEPLVDPGKNENAEVILCW
jgi:hypothetical protein